MQGKRDELQKFITKNLASASSSHVPRAGIVMTMEEKMLKIEDDMKFIACISNELHQRQKY